MPAMLGAQGIRAMLAMSGAQCIRAMHGDATRQLLLGPPRRTV